MAATPECDAEAVARVLAGDREAFAFLLERHGAAAHRLAEQLIGRQEAPDVAQEAFLRAFRYLRSYDPKRPFRAWLLRIVANVARARGGARRDEPFDEPDAASELIDSGPDPPELAEVGALREAMAAALTRLPPGERAVVYLRYAEDLTYEQLAETLDWPMSLVKNRLARGRKRLAAALGAWRPAATAESERTPKEEVPHGKAHGRRAR